MIYFVIHICDAVLKKEREREREQRKTFAISPCL